MPRDQSHAAKELLISTAGVSGITGWSVGQVREIEKWEELGQKDTLTLTARSRKESPINSNDHPPLFCWKLPVKMGKHFFFF